WRTAHRMEPVHVFGSGFRCEIVPDEALYWVPIGAHARGLIGPRKYRMEYFEAGTELGLPSLHGARDGEAEQTLLGFVGCSDGERDRIDPSDRKGLQSVDLRRHETHDALLDCETLYARYPTSSWSVVTAQPRVGTSTLSFTRNFDHVALA